MHIDGHGIDQSMASAAIGTGFVGFNSGREILIFSFPKFSNINFVRWRWDLLIQNVFGDPFGTFERQVFDAVGKCSHQACMTQDAQALILPGGGHFPNIIMPHIANPIQHSELIIDKMIVRIHQLDQLLVLLKQVSDVGGGLGLKFGLQVVIIERSMLFK